MTCDLTTINVKGFAGYEAGVFQVKDGLRNILGFSHPLERMQRCDSFVGLGSVKGCLDHAGSHRIHPNAARGVFDCEATRCGGEAALGY